MTGMELMSSVFRVAVSKVRIPRSQRMTCSLPPVMRYSAAVIFISAVSSLLQSHMITSICQRILHETRMKVFDHIHRMKLKDLDDMGSGRLLTRATNDIEALDEFYGDVLTGLFRDIFLLTGIIVMMFTMNAQLALTGFAAVPVIVAITLLCRGALKRNFAKMKAIIGHINGFIAETLSGWYKIDYLPRVCTQCGGGGYSSSDDDDTPVIPVY